MGEEGFLGDGPVPDIEAAKAVILDFAASRTLSNKCVLFISHPVYSMFITAAQTNQEV